MRDEAVHHVRVLFMLLDKSNAGLRERMESLRKTGTQYMKVDRMLGYQAAAARMFGPAAKPPGMPAGHFNTLSRAPAVFAGMWGVGREQNADGYYVGISVDDVAPHVYYLDWKGNDPFHGIILGRTGKGKTVGAQALAWRMAEQGTQVVLLEPQGHSRRLLQLAGGKNVSYSQLSYATTKLNILDVVYENPTDQYDHVLTLLGLLLDPLGNNPPGTFNVPTNLDLTLKERIVLFDFSQVPERRRPLFYYATLAGINHQVRRNPRKRAIFVDEVHYMNQEASLMTFMANMVKTVRTFGASVILIDQDLEAFIGVEGAQAESMAAGTNVTAGQFILNNSSWLISFGTKRDAAYRLAKHFKDEILPSHAEFLARMGSDDRHGKGMAVIRANGKADMIYFQLRPIEMDCLFGS